MASGGTLSTTGPGIPSHDVFANLSTNIDVKAGGTLTIANPATGFNANTLTNAGNWQVTAVGYLDIGGNSVVKSSSTGTIGVTVGSKVAQPDGTIYDSSGFGFTATGTLAVHTVGSEAEAAVITDPAGLGTSFSHFSFGRDHYKVTYVKNTSGEITNVEVKPVKS